MHGDLLRFVATVLVLFSQLFPPLMPGETRPALARGSAAHDLDDTQPGAPSLLFVENVGQFAGPVRFQARAGGHTIWLTEEALWITATEGDSRREEAESRSLSPAYGSLASDPESPLDRPHRVMNLKLTFDGANPAPSVEPSRRLTTHVSYFTGNDPSAWQRDVPVWGAVSYRDLYPGVDLELSGTSGAWAWRLVAAAGADLSAVRLRVDGADRVALDGAWLRLATSAGDVTMPLLQVAGPTHTAASLPQPHVAGAIVVTPFAPPQPPSLQAAAGPIYSTFLGSDNDDAARSVAVDAAGNAYVAGFTYSVAFTTTLGVIQPGLLGVTDAFVAKLDAGGSGLIYCTFLGGSKQDYANGIAIDGAGNAYLVGDTTSTDFPVTAGAFSGVHGNGAYDAFVLKLNAGGTSLLYSTYLGGEGPDYGRAIALNTNGQAYITGATRSANFPTTAGAWDRAFNVSRNADAFVTRLNDTGSALIYSTFLGAGKSEAAQAIAVDVLGRAYIAGTTDSPGFPTTTTAFDTTFNGGLFDGFVTRLNARGTALSYSTFLGGAGRDEAFGIAVDMSGQAYITGETTSSNFPVTGAALKRTHSALSSDVFVTKLSRTGSALVYSTYLGGDLDQRAHAIAIDGAGNAYVTGDTLSTNFPTTIGALKRSCGVDGACDFDGFYTYADAFLAKLNVAGSTLLYSTYLGGSGNDTALAVAVMGQSTAFLVGVTYSPDFPTSASAFNGTYGGLYDAFVTRLLASYTMRANSGGEAYSDSTGTMWAADRAFTANAWGYVGGVTNTTTAAISNTDDAPLYQTDRAWAPSGIPGYRFTVPNGTYTVTMKFAETKFADAGVRKFDVIIEGTTVLSSYDIFADAGAQNLAVQDKVFPQINVSDGELTIDFIKIPLFKTPKVNAIAVEQAGQ